MSHSFRIALLGSLLLAMTSGAVADEQEKPSPARVVLNKLKEWIPQVSRLGQVEPEPPAESAAATPDDQTPPDQVAPAYSVPYGGGYGRPAGSSADRKRAVVRLNHAPANDMAKTLSDFYSRQPSARSGQPYSSVYQAAGGPQVIVVPDTLSNSLIVSAPAATFEEITQMVTQLDQKPERVMIRMMIARVTQESKDGDGQLDLSAPPAAKVENEKGRAANDAALSTSHDTVAALVTRLGKTKGLELVAQPQIMTLSNQSAFLQIGERLPTLKDKPAAKPLIDYENVGLIVGVTPRVDTDDVITMEIDVERSSVADDSQGVVVAVDAAGKTLRAPRIQVTSVQTTVSTSDGQAVVLGGLTVEDGKKTSQLLIVVTPQIVR